ncbi:MAG: ADP-ribosylglycohydrolase family protein [Planctomycetales bacterium]
MTTPETRLARAKLSLEGLSVGDALGEQFFSPWIRDACILQRIVPEGRWKWTDDTAMASPLWMSCEHGHIHQRNSPASSDAGTWKGPGPWPRSA